MCDWNAAVFSILLENGLYSIKLTVLFLAFLGILIVGLYRNRTHPYAASLCLGMICYYLLMMMESHINQIPMMSFLFISCFAGQMIEQLKMEKA